MEGTTISLTGTINGVLQRASATPPPATAPPTPTPTPVATPYKDLFIAGDYLASQRVYDEFSPGNIASGTQDGFSYGIHGDVDAIGTPLANCYVTTIGGLGSTAVPQMTVRNYDFEGKLGLRVFEPRIYIGIGYLWRSNNVCYPKLSNIGFGIEKLPDLNKPFSVYGSVWYYGNVKGNFTDPSGNAYQLAYNILNYQVGVTYAFGNSPLFIEGGVVGQTLKNKINAPSAASNFGPFIGLGLKF